LLRTTACSFTYDGSLAGLPGAKRLSRAVA
jgi:hypothetical protein